MDPVSTNTVRGFHRDLAKDLRGILGYGVDTREPPGPWYKREPGQAVEFQLHTTVGALRESAKTKRGRQCQVFPLHADRANERTLWVAWQEVWVSCAHGQARKFRLAAASWLFFWGQYARGMEQLLRAEWAQPPDFGGHAAQPHWHFDRSLLPRVYDHGDLPEAGANGASESPAVGEAPATGALAPMLQGLQELTLEGLHLGMGGWNHDGPRCWQCVPANTADVRLWAVRAMSDVRSQESSFRPGQVLSP